MKNLFLTAIFTIFLGTVTQASISTVGNGNVTAVADIARINIGARSFHENISEALAENTSTIAHITEVLNDLGIENIATSNFNIWETMEFNSEGEPVLMQQINHDLTIIVTNFDLINDVIEVGANAGATNIWVSFDNSNRDQYYDQALELAIESAIRRANTVARILGKELGENIIISEDPFPATFSFMPNEDIIRAEALHIQHPAQISISASVRITFEE